MISAHKSCFIVDMKNLQEELSSVKSEKDSALEQLENVKIELRKEEGTAQKLHDDQVAQNKELYRQIEELENQVATFEKQKLVLSEELASVKADLKKEHELLLENNHDQTMNALEARLIEATDKYNGKLFSTTP